jgi:NAD(P)-dependent dehydrogenase (short-subunit alcohol dehydrogenase family)
MTVEMFEAVMRVNVTGTFICCRAVVPVMRKQGRGKIVNVASLAARTGRPGVAVNYAASKGAVISLTQTLARELGPAGIYVNAVAPGPILTDQTRQYAPDVFAAWNAGRAVGRHAGGRRRRGRLPRVRPVGLGDGRHPGRERRDPDPLTRAGGRSPAARATPLD